MKNKFIFIFAELRQKPRISNKVDFTTSCDKAELFLPQAGLLTVCTSRFSKGTGCWFLCDFERLVRFFLLARKKRFCKLERTQVREFAKAFLTMRAGKR